MLKCPGSDTWAMEWGYKILRTYGVLLFHAQFQGVRINLYETRSEYDVHMYHYYRVSSSLPSPLSSAPVAKCRPLGTKWYGMSNGTRGASLGHGCLSNRPKALRSTQMAKWGGGIRA